MFLIYQDARIKRKKCLLYEGKMDNNDRDKLVVTSAVAIAVAISIPCMLNGSPEYGVLVCLWASLCIGLYGVLK